MEHFKTLMKRENQDPLEPEGMIISRAQGGHRITENKNITLSTEVGDAGSTFIHMSQSPSKFV